MIHSYKYTLDKSPKKYPCPGCGKKTFVRYQDTETGDFLPDQFGRCDREISCGYFRKPEKQSGTFTHTAPERPTEVFYIPFGVLKKTLAGYNQNTFLQNLLKTFDPADVERIVSLYYLGTITSGFRAGAITFPYIDKEGNIRAVQVKQFDHSNHTTGTGFLHSMIESDLKRNRQPVPGWLSDYLRNETKVSCLFGAHLLKRYQRNPVALVEAPKTAILGTLSFGFPDNPKNLLWCAVYNLSSLTLDKVRPLQGREVFLFPDLSKDGSAFDLWKRRAEDFSALMPGTRFTVSDFLETKAPDPDKVKGCDIADYLNEKRVKNEDEKQSFSLVDAVKKQLSGISMKNMILNHDRLPGITDYNIRMLRDDLKYNHGITLTKRRYLLTLKSILCN